MKTIDLSSWNRKEHFEFFQQFDDPFVGITSEVDCTLAYEFCKEHDISFFATYLYQVIKAVNSVEAFRLRVNQGKVVLFDEIHVSSTLGRKDGTFAFSYVRFEVTFEDFYANLQKEMQEVRDSDGLRLTEEALRLNLIHFTAFPWHRFTGIKHPKSINLKDSVPKISVGKASQQNEKMIMAVDVQVHHGLADGIHISQFLDALQNNLNSIF